MRTANARVRARPLPAHHRRPGHDAERLALAAGHRDGHGGGVSAALRGRGHRRELGRDRGPLRHAQNVRVGGDYSKKGFRLSGDARVGVTGAMSLTKLSLPGPNQIAQILLNPISTSANLSLQPIRKRTRK